MGCYGTLRSEGPTPIVFVYVFRCRTYSAPIPANRHITALTDRPIRCRAFSPRSLEFVKLTLNYLIAILAVGSPLADTERVPFLPFLLTTARQRPCHVRCLVSKYGSSSLISALPAARNVTPVAAKVNSVSDAGTCCDE